MNAGTLSPVVIADVRQHLQEALCSHFGRTRRIRGLRRRRSNYSSSYAIENLEVDLDGGTRLSLVFKNLSPASMLEEARQVRPDFLCDPRREIRVYRELLKRDLFGTPEFFGAVEQPDRERYWLFLERVEGPLLWQVGRFEQWQQAARWLGQFHEHFRQHSPRNGPTAEALLLYDKRHCLRWIKRAERFVLRRAGVFSSKEKRELGRLVENFEQVVNRLLTFPQGVIHGEFYPSNVLCRSSGKTRQICPIDWEAAAIGPGLIDLAALTSGQWSQEEKQRLVKAYLESCGGDNGLPAVAVDLMEWVEYGQLYLAVQWLGWAADWSPPKHHARNWLGEALRLAKRLGLGTRITRRPRIKQTRIASSNSRIARGKQSNDDV